MSIEEMTPEMMRAVQLNSELGAYATANLSGAYDLFREFWNVAMKARPAAEKAGGLSPSAGLSAADITKIGQYGAEVVIMQKNATICARKLSATV